MQVKLFFPAPHGSSILLMAKKIAAKTRARQKGDFPGPGLDNVGGRMGIVGDGVGTAAVIYRR